MLSLRNHVSISDHLFSKESNKTNNSSFAIVAICVRFEEFDQTFVEGRDSDLLFLRKPQTDDPVAVTVNLFTVDEFQAFINSSNRTLDDVTITRIEGIEFPATGQQNIFITLN